MQTVTIHAKIGDTPVLGSDDLSLPEWEWRFKMFAQRLDLDSLFFTEAGTPTAEAAEDEAQKKKFVDASAILSHAAKERLYSIDHARTELAQSPEH